MALSALRRDGGVGRVGRPEGGQRAPRNLFVYGSLMAAFHGALGAPQRRLLRWHARPLCLATLPGLLFDRGCYPVAITSERVSVRVHGEIWRIVDGRRLWPALDVYENLDDPNPEYIRILVRVRLTSGRTVAAWTYRFIGDTAGMPRLIGGRWAG